MEFNINDIIASTRRETLLNVLNIFEDEGLLKDVAGENTLLDVTMLLLAENDTVLFNKLNSVVSVDDLRNDIKHVCNTAYIRRQFIEKKNNLR